MNEAERAESALEKCGKIIEEEAKAAQQNPKNTKERARKLLSALQQVVETLEAGAEFNTVAKAAVGIFKGILKLEDNRRDNNEQIMVVYFTMVQALSTLRTLHKNSEDNAELNKAIDACCITMKEFGVFADVYYNQYNRLTRFLRATKIKERIVNFTNTFNEHRAKISFILDVDATVNMGVVMTNIKLILDRLGIPSSKAESKAANIVAAYDPNAGALVEDRDELQAISNILSGPSAPAVTSLTIETLTADIDQLMQINHDSFERKLQSAQKEIQELIDRSTATIMKQLTKGAHNLLDDPDVKQIWEESGWKLGVECRVFMDAVYTHFAMKQAASETDVGDDSWTYKVIAKVNTHPAIGEAIDEDASGFLSVHEVNHFLKKKPINYTTPMWLVYWGVGWSYMNTEYTKKIKSTLKRMKPKCEELKKRCSPRQNEADSTASTVATIERFADTIQKLQYVMTWLDETDAADGQDIRLDYDTATADKILGLAQGISEDVLTLLKQNLADRGYKIEGDSLSALIGETDVRIELFFMPLLSALFENFQPTFDVLTQSQSALTNEDLIDFEKMNDNVYELLYEFNQRMDSLLRSWRAQKLDDELQVEFYAGGLMYGWYKKYEDTKISDAIDDYLFTDSESEAGEDSADDGDSSDGEGDESNTEDHPVTSTELSSHISVLERRLTAMEAVLARILSALPNATT